MRAAIVQFVAVQIHRSDSGDIAAGDHRPRDWGVRLKKGFTSSSLSASSATRASASVFDSMSSFSCRPAAVGDPSSLSRPR
jgi:hypothetical protein